MAITYLQSGSTINVASGTSGGDTYLGAVTAGSLLVIGIRIGALGRTVTVTDSGGGTWFQACTVQQATDGHQAYIYYFWNAPGGTTSVTVAISGAAASIRAAMAEYSGIITADIPVDQTSTNSGQGTGATADSNATATTSQAEELLFGLNTNDNTINAAWVANIGGGGTIRQTVTGQQAVAISDLAVNATGTYNNNPSYTGFQLWTSLIATFKAPGAAAPPAVPPPPPERPTFIYMRKREGRVRL